MCDIKDMMHMRVSAIIPAFDEEDAIGRVVADIREYVDEVIVADNGSTDETANEAWKAGANVVYEGRRGYGYACMKAISTVSDSDIILFLDGDGADDPEYATKLIDPIRRQDYDFVVGSRMNGPNAHILPPHSRAGNWFFARLINLLHGSHYSDLGPYRAIRYDSLKSLNMLEPKYGWTAEMQIKAVKSGLSVFEVPVPYRSRTGYSKVTGNPWISLKAAFRITHTILKSAWI